MSKKLRLIFCIVIVLLLAIAGLLGWIDNGPRTTVIDVEALPSRLTP